MKRCKCGSTELRLVEEKTTTTYSKVDADGQGDEVVYESDFDVEFICYECERCHAQYVTWDEVPEA